MLKKDGGMRWWNHFQSAARYPLGARVCACAALTRRAGGVKSLSSNLYDGLNNYPAFSAQFVYEAADSPRLTLVRIALVGSYVLLLRCSGCDEIVNCCAVLRFVLRFLIFVFFATVGVIGNIDCWILACMIGKILYYVTFCCFLLLHILYYIKLIH